MFHATVVTSTQFFQVKVLNSDLKEKFTKRKVIIISCYFECKGILEINEASSVSEAGADEQVEVQTGSSKEQMKRPRLIIFTSKPQEHLCMGCLCYIR